jgi:hypothetical protein
LDEGVCVLKLNSYFGYYMLSFLKLGNFPSESAPPPIKIPKLNVELN